MRLTPDIPTNLDHLVAVVMHDSSGARRAQAANAIYAAGVAAGMRQVLGAVRPLAGSKEARPCATT